MKQYKGFIIPDNINKRLIVRVLDHKEYCPVQVREIKNHCQKQHHCIGCLFHNIDKSYGALIDYALQEKYITKCEALQYTLDKSN